MRENSDDTEEAPIATSTRVPPEKWTEDDESDEEAASPPIESSTRVP